MASWSQTTPAAEPVTLLDVKEHLRVSGTAEDTLVEHLIKAARQRVENFTGRALITRTVTLDLTARESRSPIRLMYPPVASITSVTGYDNAGNTTLVSSANYVLVGGLELIEAPDTTGWAEEAERLAWALRIVYSTGYGASYDNVPWDLKQSILTLIADLYEMRQSETTGTSVTRFAQDWQALARPYRVNKLTSVY